MKAANQSPSPAWEGLIGFIGLSAKLTGQHPLSISREAGRQRISHLLY
jgi:hypothetical protein